MQQNTQVPSQHLRLHPVAPVEGALSLQKNKKNIRQYGPKKNYKWLLQNHLTTKQWQVFIKGASGPVLLS